MASYPTSVVNWTQRINGETVWAADPNSLAAEITALETYIGPNPQIESTAVNGATKTFSSMSARLSAASQQTGHPFIEVSSNQSAGFKVPHSGFGANDNTIKNYYSQVSGQWPGYVNANGFVTIKNAGIWLINVDQTWGYASSGWVQHILYNGGNQLRRSVFNYSGFPGSGSDAYGERFIGESGHTSSTFLGFLPASTVVSVSSGNYTNVNPLQVNSMSLSLYYMRPGVG